jgi:hypothetical protein
MSGDDRGVRMRRWAWWPILWLFLALTALSTLLLYLFAPRTDELFAWTINPPISAAFLGGGYAAGFLLIVLTARDPVWARNRIGLVTVWVFIGLTLVATLVHLDLFHFDASPAWARFAAWLWTAVYVVTPVWMGGLFLLQRRAPGVDPPVRRTLPGAAAGVLVAQAVVLLAAGAALMLAPAWADRWWAWPLAPLAGRAIGAWLVALGFAAVLVVLGRDLGRAGAASATYVAFGQLQVGALVRFSGDVDWGRAAAWAWLVVLVSIIVMGLYGLTANRRRPDRSGSAG